MHVNSKKMTLLLVIIIATAFLFFVFGVNHKFEGLGWGTDSIEESRDIGAYVGSYTVTPTTIRVFDSMNVNVREMWIEKYWTYGHYVGTINMNADATKLFLCVSSRVTGTWNMRQGSDRIELILESESSDTENAIRRFSKQVDSPPPDSVQLLLLRRRFTGGEMILDTGAILVATRRD